MGSHLTEKWPSCLLVQKSKATIPVLKKASEKMYALTPEALVSMQE